MKIPDFWLCEKCEPNSGDNNVRKGVNEVIKLPLQEKENVRFAATISLQTVSVVNFKLQKRFLTTKGTFYSSDYLFFIFPFFNWRNYQLCVTGWIKRNSSSILFKLLYYHLI
jgi:hypothetical protein